MAEAGHLASVAITGASTAMTAEAMNLVSGKVYKIANAAKEVWDPAVAVVIKDNGVVVAASDILSLDYLHGKVEFAAAYTPTTPVTFSSGSYLPRTTVANAHTITINRSRDLLEKTVFGDTSKKKLAGLQDASGDISLRETLLSTVGGGASLKDLFNAGSIFVISFLPSPTGDALRLRVIIESAPINGDVAAQVDSQLSYQLAGTESVDGYSVNIAPGP